MKRVAKQVAVDEVAVKKAVKRVAKKVATGSRSEEGRREEGSG